MNINNVVLLKLFKTNSEGTFFQQTGFEKYLNSTLPIGQVTLKFCLPGGLLRLPQFSTSIIIYEPKNGSQTTGVFQCNKPILTVVLLVLITFMSTDTKMSLRIKFCPSASFMPCLPVEETKFAKLLLFVCALSCCINYTNLFNSLKIDIVFGSLNVHLHLV